MFLKNIAALALMSLASSVFHAEANPGAAKFVMDEQKKKEALLTEDNSLASAPYNVVNDSFVRVHFFIRKGPYFRLCPPSDPRGEITVRSSDAVCEVAIKNKKESRLSLPSYSFVFVNDYSPQEYLDELYGKGVTIYTGMGFQSKPRLSMRELDVDISLVLFYKTTKSYSEWFNDDTTP